MGAVFLDGLQARRRPVEIVLLAAGIDIVQDGDVLAHWPYDDLRREASEGSDLNLACVSAPDLARLIVSDQALSDAIAARSPFLDKPTSSSETRGMVIVGWSLAAAISLVLTVLYLVPHVADRLAPLVPWSWEERLGRATDGQVRAIFSGEACNAPDGRAALNKMMAALTAKADLPIPIVTQVIESSFPNAIALPGGRIYVFEPLLARAESPDEVAGVLAHEIGHVIGRDGLRRMIQTGGSSFLLGLLLGDVSGSGALILAGRMLIDSAYSREAESAADEFAARTMQSLGRPARPMGNFLLRLTGKQGGGLGQMFAQHPLSEDRQERLAQYPTQASAPQILSEREWRALKAICSPS